jgi:hypothetical protein
MRIIELCLGRNLINRFEAWLIALAVSEIAAVESPTKGTTAVIPNSRVSLTAATNLYPLVIQSV